MKKSRYFWIHVRGPTYLKRYFGRHCTVNLVMLGGLSLKAEVSTLIGLFWALNDSHSFMMDVSPPSWPEFMEIKIVCPTDCLNDCFEIMYLNHVVNKEQLQVIIQARCNQLEPLGLLLFVTSVPEQCFPHNWTPGQAQTYGKYGWWWNNIQY